MLTDDPGTPGNGRVELNVALTTEHFCHEQSWELPLIDFNYGLGDRVQLNFEASAAVFNRSGRGPVGSLGSSGAAVKWRFLDEERDGISVSVYPRIEWSSLRSSVRRGLAEEGTRVFLPVEMERSLGPVAVGFETGCLLSTIGRSRLVYGLVAGIGVTSKTTLMAELHGSARTDFDADELIINVGVRQKLTDSTSLLGSVGHGVRNPAD